MNKSKVSIIMPAFNEAATLERIVSRVFAVPGLDVYELVIVDDCSTDNTLAIATELATSNPQIRVLRLDTNQGKTAAVKKGIEAASGDIICIQDADLEYNPEDLVSVLEPLRDGIADVVYGSRFLVKKAARVLYFYHYLANKFLTFLSNLLTNHNMTDIETCYKAFRAPIIKEMELSSHGFGMEVEITAKVCKLGVRIYEVPISYYGRTYEEGKKIGYKDGLKAIWYVLKYNLFSVRSSRFKLYKRNLMVCLPSGEKNP